MSNENQNVELHEEKCNCICHSKGFRKFLVVAMGSFVGVLLALSLFAALHKPPMPIPMPCPCGYHGGCPMAMKHHHKFDKSMRGDFHQKMIKEAPVRVEIDD